MSFAFPLTCQVRPRTQAEGASRTLANPAEGAASSAPCDLQPMDADAAFREWGIEVERPAKLFVRAGDAGLFGIGARVMAGGREWSVLAAPSPRVYGSPLDHAVIPLRFLEVA